jgi:hypothetical protein
MNPIHQRKKEKSLLKRWEDQRRELFQQLMQSWVLFRLLCFILMILAPDSPPEFTYFHKAIVNMAPYIWDGGKSQIDLPIEKIKEPQPEWGARARNEEHVKVFII